MENLFFFNNKYSIHEPKNTNIVTHSPVKPMKALIISIFVLFSFCPLFGRVPHRSPTETILDGTPYLLPDDHPLKQSIKEIFLSSKILKNQTTFSRGGFTIISDRKRNGMKVVSHPKAPGYLFKFFLDSDQFFSYRRQRNNFIRRCQGAQLVQQQINEQNIQHFCVPAKWIVEIDETHIVLVVERINICSEKATKAAWKTQITPQALDELYLLLNTLPISRRLDENLPYTKEGKFAFIDTEARHKKFLSVQRFLSPSMKKYWFKILQQQEVSS